MGYLPVEGGGLNASYTTVDAIANICTTAGNLGMRYGKDFIWAYHGYDNDDDDCLHLNPLPSNNMMILYNNIKYNTIWFVIKWYNSITLCYNTVSS